MSNLKTANENDIELAAREGGLPEFSPIHKFVIWP